MSGDHGPAAVIEGAKHALEADTAITKLHLVGNEAEIRAGCQRLGLNDPRVEFTHASEVLTMEDKPVEAIRRKRDCSMARAIGLVYDDRADAVVSLGNTGALVAGSMRLRRLEGVERPAIAARMPSRTGDFVLLDAGATPVCEPLHLAQFAVMGSLYAREMLGQPNPRVGILSNGSEETKGNELTREAARLCGELGLNFVGYVEGFDIFDDQVDVVVTDGFTGNIVLKTSEGLGNAIGHLIKRELGAGPVRMLGALLARGALRALKRRMDPEVYGGAVLLGLNGTVIKAHGKARPRAIASAIRVTVDEVRHDVNQKLTAEIARANQRLAALGSETQTTVHA